MGLFIVFEGGEGTGKSTQVKILYNRLRRDKNYRNSVICTHEPGGTVFGEILRRIVTSPEGGIKAASTESSQLLLVAPPLGDQAIPDVILGPTAPRAEFLYFLLARAQLVEEVIKPNLDKGKIVISDRFAPSSVAYQGYGRGLDLALIHEANSVATHNLEPDLILLLDIEVELGFARKWGSEKLDRLEQEDIVFHQRVRGGYLKLAEAEPERWLVIDATQSRKRIAGIIWERVSRLLDDAGEIDD